MKNPGASSKLDPQFDDWLHILGISNRKVAEVEEVFVTSPSFTLLYPGNS
jgi:hypothetical protein